MSGIYFDAYNFPIAWFLTPGSLLDKSTRELWRNMNERPKRRTEKVGKWNTFMINSDSVFDQQSVGSSPGRDTCVRNTCVRNTCVREQSTTPLLLRPLDPFKDSGHFW